MRNYLTQNKKMRKSSGGKLYNWGIPAFKAADGFRTCPMAGICAKGCYATMHAYTWGVVKNAYERRLELSKSDTFVDVLVAEIQRRKIKRVRVHDAGDFYDEFYLYRWLLIAAACPDTEFYAYTKMVELCNNTRYTGTNMTYIYSYGGKQDDLINPETDRHSRVFLDLASLQALGYADASNDDTVALGPNPKIGLIYHGYKSKAWSGKTKERQAA